MEKAKNNAAFDPDRENILPNIKARVCMVGKKLVDLGEEAARRGASVNDPSVITVALSGRSGSDNAKLVRKLSEEIVSEWECEKRGSRKGGRKRCN